MGSVSPGDRIAWTTADCSTITATQDPTDGTNAATTFTFAEPGLYKLCYKKESDEGAAVEQPGIALEVSEGAPPHDQQASLMTTRPYDLLDPRHALLRPSSK